MPTGRLKAEPHSMRVIKNPMLQNSAVAKQRKCSKHLKKKKVKKEKKEKEKKKKKKRKMNAFIFQYYSFFHFPYLRVP